MISKITTFVVGVLLGILGVAVFTSTDAIVLTGFFTLGGAAVGGLITAGVTYITTERQNASEEKRLQLQLLHERTQASILLKRDCYSELVSFFIKMTIGVGSGEPFLEHSTPEEKDRYHICMNLAKLVAGEKVDNLINEFIKAGPNSKALADEKDREAKFQALKMIADNLRKEMREELELK